MPELPEVETVARSLRECAPVLVGRIVQRVQVLWHKEISGIAPELFATRVTGATVQSVGRHGKYLMIALATSSQQPATTMFVHLKMSGRLEVVPNEQALTKHARVVWWLDEGVALRFEDARKFGRVFLPDTPEKLLLRLGADAIQISEAEFVQKLLCKKGALKPILLDQTFVAGVGNIYADESLHLAKLHPKRLASTLTRADAQRLYATVQRVLAEGIAANGASFDWVYPDGNFQESFKVYGQTGKLCVHCGATIQRILVGQRSTHFCPQCQQ